MTCLVPFIYWYPSIPPSWYPSIQVDSLRFSLHHEAESNANNKEARLNLEASLADMNRQLQGLTQECSAMQLQHMSASQKVSHGEKALDKLGMELEHVRREVRQTLTEGSGLREEFVSQRVARRGDHRSREELKVESSQACVPFTPNVLSSMPRRSIWQRSRPRLRCFSMPTLRCRHK